ncbi:probable dis1-suppressing protein kinase dsk1 [Rhynchosporium graminicola]|uniref:non-specific serine/threonine protein kinase n=1 Tax=Rhynchosporium graminicola TaxID=2792576 RepID=A0A1E1KQL0_9HELO|nr:probable dis1-suppressing protein kinase dsk1 [Rhynchosporium commune]
MALLLKWARAITRRAPSPPLRFPTSGFDILPASPLIDEEQFEGFSQGIYYPVKIGQVYASKYQVVGKLGCGGASTVWLARDLHAHGHVALKVYTRNAHSEEEFENYSRIRQGNQSHRGRHFVRTALETFKIPRPGGDHACLVQKPMWESLRELRLRAANGVFSEQLLKGTLEQLFLALDYLHTECKLIHTDIKADNILNQIEDASILDAFEEAELEHPSPRKIVDGVTIYASRQFDVPKVFGDSVLSDFGSAVPGDIKRNHNAVPNVYRPPEIMTKAEWSYPVDIWNVGAMIWDVFEGRHLFNGQDSNGKGWSTRAQLAEVVALLAPPPLDMLQKGLRSKEFFDVDGKWIAEMPIPEGRTLESLETRLEGENKELFLQMMRGMLTWRPEERKTAKQMLDEPWLKM